MFTLVTGGAASGKSEYAESLALRLPGRRIYLATMRPADPESLARINRHRLLRQGRGFDTLERYTAAFSMFSALPVPQVEWNETSMHWMLAAFPLVGLVTGGACWAWQLLCGALTLPDILRGAGLCLLPVLVTGGVHLDGYADTCDALASHASPQRRQEILKDPHLGAFAAIRLCCYFLASSPSGQPWYPSADSPGIWRAGFCRPPNSGCWPPPVPRSTFNL